LGFVFHNVYHYATGAFSFPAPSCPDTPSPARYPVLIQATDVVQSQVRRHCTTHDHPVRSQRTFAKSLTPEQTGYAMSLCHTQPLRHAHDLRDDIARTITANRETNTGRGRITCPAKNGPTPSLHDPQKHLLKDLLPGHHAPWPERPSAAASVPAAVAVPHAHLRAQLPAH
jgi:hypothetical protein